MSHITVHDHPDGILVKIPDGQKIDAINVNRILSEIQEILCARFRAKARAMSFVDLVAMSLDGSVDKSEAGIVYEELQARLDRLSAHDRVRLGMVK